MNLLRVDWVRVLLVELSVLVGLALLYIAGHLIERISHTLLLLGASTAVALLVAPAVGRLEARLRHRLVATVIVYVCVLAVFGTGVALVAAPLISEATAFARDLPARVDQLAELAYGVERLANSWGIPLQVAELASQAARQIQATGSMVLAGTVAIAAAVSGAVADVAIALVLSFYLSVDGPRLRQRLVDRVPSQHNAQVLRIETSVRRVFVGYVRGQIILALSLGLVAGIGAALLGLPYPVVIGVLAAVFELIPMFGSLLGAIPAIIVALFQPFPTVLWVILFFLAVNQVENYLLAPRVTGETLGLPPLGALLALLIGVEVAGFLGAVLVVPIAALIMDLAAPAPESANPVQGADLPADG